MGQEMDTELSAKPLEQSHLEAAWVKQAQLFKGMGVTGRAKTSRKALRLEDGKTCQQKWNMELSLAAW